MNDNEQTAAFLKRQTHMVIAVVLGDGSPWAVPVRIKRQSGAEFEWDSHLETLHSQAIATRPTMSAVVYEKRPDDQFGLYMKGQGVLVSTQDDMGHYRFIAEHAWINDETFVKREVEL